MGPRTPSSPFSQRKPNRFKAMLTRTPLTPTLSSQPEDEQKHQERLLLPENALAAPLALSKSKSVDSIEEASIVIEDLQNRERVLNHALATILEVASMDAASYQKMLTNNRMPCISDDVHSPAIAKLDDAVHKFHSRVAILTAENDEQTTELHELREALKQSQARTTKLEKGIRKLFERNQRLKAKLDSKETLTNKIIQRVQKRVGNQQRKEEKEFLKMASLVQQHEINMLSRERCDSGFSEFDGLQDFHDSGSMGSASNASGQSLVTDDGVATIRISRDRSSTWPRPADEALMTDDTGSPASPRATTKSEDSTSSNMFGSFMSNTPTSQGRASQSLDSPSFGVNLFGSSSTSTNTHRHGQPYTLVIEAPVGLQFVKLALSENQPSLNASLLSDSDDRAAQQAADASFAFAVCGYHGFNADVNVKPTLGARIMSIDKQDVSVDTSVEALQERIDRCGRKLRITFRNDHWSEQQRDVLSKAAREISDKNPEANPVQHAFGNLLPSRRKVSSGDSHTVPTGKNILGFLKMGHNNKDDETSAAPCDKSEGENGTGKVGGMMSFFHRSKDEGIDKSCEVLSPIQSMPSVDDDDPGTVPSEEKNAATKPPPKNHEVNTSQPSENHAANALKSSMKSFGRLFGSNKKGDLTAQVVKVLAAPSEHTQHVPTTEAKLSKVEGNVPNAESEGNAKNALPVETLKMNETSSPESEVATFEATSQSEAQGHATENEVSDESLLHDAREQTKVLDAGAVVITDAV